MSEERGNHDTLGRRDRIPAAAVEELGANGYAVVRTAAIAARAVMVAETVSGEGEPWTAYRRLLATRLPKTPEAP